MKTGPLPCWQQMQWFSCVTASMMIPFSLVQSCCHFVELLPRATTTSIVQYQQFLAIDKSNHIENCCSKNNWGLFYCVQREWHSPMVTHKSQMLSWYFKIHLAGLSVIGGCESIIDQVCDLTNVMQQQEGWQHKLYPSMMRWLFNCNWTAY